MKARCERNKESVRVLRMTFRRLRLASLSPEFFMVLYLVPPFYRRLEFCNLLIRCSLCGRFNRGTVD